MWPCSAGSIIGRGAVSADVDSPAVGSDRALPLVAAAAALFRRLRLAAALAVAALLKVSLESVAKVFVQRGRPGL